MDQQQHPMEKGIGLTVTECEALSKAGLQIFSIWELNKAPANHSRIGANPFGIGQNDADQAFDSAAALGQPTSAPVYFAIDYAVGSNFPDIKKYFEGIVDRSKQRVRDSKPVYPVGVYCVISPSTVLHFRIIDDLRCSHQIPNPDICHLVSICAHYSP
jgi:hypothetical protein